jgi:hypothetical protein
VLDCMFRMLEMDRARVKIDARVWRVWMAHQGAWTSLRLYSTYASHHKPHRPSIDSSKGQGGEGGDPCATMLAGSPSAQT